jgi:hypothetical protein
LDEPDGIFLGEGMSRNVRDCTPTKFGSMDSAIANQDLEQSHRQLRRVVFMTKTTMRRSANVPIPNRLRSSPRQPQRRSVGTIFARSE